MSASRVVLVSLALGGCGAPPSGAPPRAPTPEGAEATATRPAATAPETGTDGGLRDGPGEESPTAPPSPQTGATPGAMRGAPGTPATVFPPVDFPPPSARSAAPGDGIWTPLGDAQRRERAATSPPVLVRTVVHPHPTSRFVTVTIAAVDLSRVGLRLVPGTEDLSWAKVPEDPTAGLVPAADHGALVFVMNGGFQPKHGRWGLMAGGAIVTEPREDGCTLALYRDGAVRLAPWPRLASTRADQVAHRQAPPCLVDEGAIHPDLLRGKDRAWAGHAADVKTQRRSAVGLDAAGRTLFYALGEEAEARHLAEALRVAGAAVAAELDINWYWTRFLLFGETNAGVRVTSTLIPKTEHQPHGYVVRASTRDFFYGVLR